MRLHRDGGAAKCLRIASDGTDGDVRRQLRIRRSAVRPSLGALRIRALRTAIPYLDASPTARFAIHHTPPHFKIRPCPRMASALPRAAGDIRDRRADQLAEAGALVERQTPEPPVGLLVEGNGCGLHPRSLRRLGR